MTFVEKFDYLKKKYASKVETEKFSDSFLAVQITLTDEDCGGTFYAAYADGVFSFEPYDYRDNTAAVNISSHTLEKLFSGKAKALDEYNAGRISVVGSLSHALQLVDAVKKAPVKCRKEKASAAEGTKKADATKKTPTAKGKKAGKAQ